MADLSDLKYPDQLSGLTFYDGDEWMGGIDWLVSGTPGRTYKFNEVRPINIGDYFSASEIGDSTKIKYAPLCKLLNNSEVKLK